MTSWRILAPAIAVACCAQHCSPHPVEAVVFVGADADDTDHSDSDIDDAGLDGAASDTGALVWPNPGHTTNSDPWIAQNHDKITLMQPQVLFLDFANEFTLEDGGVVEANYPLLKTLQPLINLHIEAFETASRYQGYNDPNAPTFLQYQVTPNHIIDLRDGNGQVNSSNLPISGGAVDYSALNSTRFASLIGIEDTDNPPTYLTLCSLFTKGIINEVWGMVADPLATPQGTPPGPPSVKFASFVETKQVYDSSDRPVTGQVCTSVPGASCQLSCGVTIRFFDFNPGRGPGCHLFASGLQWPQYVEPTATVLPHLQKVAQTFFNFDFEERFDAGFASFFDVCPSGVSDAGPCIEWPTNLNATSGVGSSESFNFPNMSAGCGNVVFPPNATDYSTQAGDISVLSSCESYGLHYSDGGREPPVPYTNRHVDAGYPTGPALNDCGNKQPAYLLASMPGYGTTATASDGTPMKNWWVYLFY